MVGEAGPQSLTSEVSTLGPELVTSDTQASVQRKRSQSLADIQVPFLSLGGGGGGQTHKKFTKTKSEESGYDSDTTRKSGSGSPRGSVKSGDFETESASSTDLSNTGEEKYRKYHTELVSSLCSFGFYEIIIYSNPDWQQFFVFPSQFDGWENNKTGVKLCLTDQAG